MFCGSKSVDNAVAKLLILRAYETKAKSVDASSIRHKAKVALD